MAKGETRQTYRETREQRQNTQNQFNNAITGSNDRANELAPTVQAGNEEIAGGYRGMIGSGGGLDYTPIAAPTVEFEGISGAPEVSTGTLRDVGQQWKTFTEQGGIRQEDQDRIRGDIAGIRTIGNTAGVTDENIARLRGNGVYDEFALTGGYTPEQRANIKARALAPISSMASGTRDELARRRNLSGGYAPGFDAASQELRRGTARDIASTALGANVEVQERVNAGRLAGAAGVATGEQNVVSAIQADLQRRTGALFDAAQLESQLADAIARYTAMGISGQEATARAIADVEAINMQEANRVNMFNASGKFNAATFNAGNAFTANQLNSANQLGVDQFNITNPQQQTAAGLAGLTGVNNVNVGMLENERDRGVNLLGAGTQANLGYLNNQAGLATQPGIGGNIVGAIGAGAGIASQFFAPGLRPSVQGVRV